MRLLFLRLAATALSMSVLSDAIADDSVARDDASQPANAIVPASELSWRRLPPPDHTLANFRPGETPDYCFDRATQPYTAVVDTHFHPKPFGGPAMDAQGLWETFDRLGVRFVNYFGIGQVLALEANCSYYLDCPGVTAIPSIKNDFMNGLEVAAHDPDKIHITLSMTFIDLAHAENAVEMIALYDGRTQHYETGVAGQ
jgi:hypothetical protein